MFCVVPRLIIATAVTALCGCGGGRIPKEALALSGESLERRQIQTRKFDTSDESKLLTAAVGLVQDLGFNIDASKSSLGLLVGSKQRDATDGGQIAGAVVIAALFGVATSVDRDQIIRVSVVTRPQGTQTTLRVTFQRVVRNTEGATTKLEFIKDEAIYRTFFEKLSKAVFLEAQNI
jgi:hypothetical protein